MIKTDKVIVDSIGKPDLEEARQIEEKVILMDKFSIEPGVAFWHAYFKLPRPKGRRIKPYRSRR